MLSKALWFSAMSIEISVAFFKETEQNFTEIFMDTQKNTNHQSNDEGEKIRGITFPFNLM